MSVTPHRLSSKLDDSPFLIFLFSHQFLSAQPPNTQIKIPTTPAPKYPAERRNVIAQMYQREMMRRSNEEKKESSQLSLIACQNLHH
jgi:hypothetical protein